MIEPRASVSPPALPAVERERPPAPRLPVSARTGRIMVLAGVFVCAACGLVYELELVALASYVVGDSVTPTSVVLSLMVFAMGVGSLAAKRLRPHAALGFGVLEAVLALIGGASAMSLYAAFAWLGGGYGATDATCWLLVLFSLAIGLLIGAEVPLLMVLIQRVRRQDPGIVVADLFAADYVGALAGGLAFPFLLLPMLGQLTGALLTGAVNAVAGAALVLGVFRGDLSGRGRRLLVVANVTVLALLAASAVLADDFERAARRAVYGADPRVALHSDGRDVVLTGGPRGPFTVYLNGKVWLRSADEPAPHRGLVAAAGTGRRARVLVLGGGDGLAVHEVLRRGGVQRVDVVTSLTDLVRLARTDPALAALSGHALRDPRVHFTPDEPFDHLRHLRRRYDLVIADVADPGQTGGAKLSSLEFYGLAGRVLAPDGRLVVRAGRPTPRTTDFWTVEASVRAAGLHAVPYCVGRWSFVLAGHGNIAPLQRRADTAGTARAGAAGGVARTAAAAPARAEAEGARAWARVCSGAGGEPVDVSALRPPGTAPSTLVHPRYGG